MTSLQKAKRHLVETAVRRCLGVVQPEGYSDLPRDAQLAVVQAEPCRAQAVPRTGPGGPHVLIVLPGSQKARSVGELPDTFCSWCFLVTKILDNGDLPGLQNVR